MGGRRDASATAGSACASTHAPSAACAVSEAPPVSMSRVEAAAAHTRAASTAIDARETPGTTRLGATSRASVSAPAVTQVQSANASRGVMPSGVRAANVQGRESRPRVALASTPGLASGAGDHALRASAASAPAPSPTSASASGACVSRSVQAAKSVMKATMAVSGTREGASRPTARRLAAMRASDWSMSSRSACNILFSRNE